MNKNLVFAYDVGTSGTKAALVSPDGIIIDTDLFEYNLTHPKAGWAEQDPMDFWNAIVTTTQNIIEKNNINKDDIDAVIFTCQAQGIIPIDSANNILHNNISWVDGRAEDQARQMMNRLGGRRIFKKIIGIEISSRDVIPKLMWLKQIKPDIYKKTEKFLDVNGFLKFKATGEKVAEWSGACSYAFDVKKKDWDRIVFRIMGIDLNKLAPLVRSIDKIGNGLTELAAKELGLNTGTIVFGGCDDTQSATVGSTAIGEGEAHIYLGTSSWFSVSTSRAPKFQNGAVTLQSADPEKNIVIGVSEAACSNLEWAVRELYTKDGVKTTDTNIYELMDEEISSVPAGSDHLIFTPWAIGERSPVTSTYTRSTIYNMTFTHTRAHIVRAIDEGIAYNMRWIIENFAKDFSFMPKSAKVIGGGSQSKVWMQILADVTKLRIETLDQSKYAGALGAAMTAFVGLGIHKNFMKVKEILKITNVFEPNPDNFEVYDKLFKDFKSIYNSLHKSYIKSNKSRLK